MSQYFPKSCEGYTGSVKETTDVDTSNLAAKLV